MQGESILSMHSIDKKYTLTKKTNYGSNFLVTARNFKLRFIHSKGIFLHLNGRKNTIHTRCVHLNIADIGGNTLSNQNLDINIHNLRDEFDVARSSCINTNDIEKSLEDLFPKEVRPDENIEYHTIEWHKEYIDLKLEDSHEQKTYFILNNRKDNITIKTDKIPNLTIFSNQSIDLTNTFWENMTNKKSGISIQSNRYDVSFKHLTKLEI